MKKDSPKHRSDARALRSGLHLLFYVLKKGSGVSFSELESRCEMSRSSMVRLLRELLDTGFLRKDQENGLYYPGIRWSFLGDYFHWIQMIKKETVKILERVKDEVRNTVIVFIREGNYLYSFAKVLYPDSVVMQDVGNRIAEFCSSPWCVMLLMERVKEEQRKMEEILQESDSSYPLEYSWVEQYRLKDWIIDDGIRFTGIRRLVVPIRDKRGFFLGAIGVGGTVHSLPESDWEKVVEVLRDAANELSEVWKDISWQNFPLLNKKKEEEK